jgi:hypothetical protein
MSGCQRRRRPTGLSGGALQVPGEGKRIASAVAPSSGRQRQARSIGRVSARTGRMDACRSRANSRGVWLRRRYPRPRATRCPVKAQHRAGLLPHSLNKRQTSLCPAGPPECTLRRLPSQSSEDDYRPRRLNRVVEVPCSGQQHAGSVEPASLGLNVMETWEIEFARWTVSDVVRGDSSTTTCPPSGTPVTTGPDLSAGAPGDRTRSSRRRSRPRPAASVFASTQASPRALYSRRGNR